MYTGRDGMSTREGGKKNFSFIFDLDLVCHRNSQRPFHYLNTCGLVKIPFDFVF